LPSAKATNSLVAALNGPTLTAVIRNPGISTFPNCHSEFDV